MTIPSSHAVQSARLVRQVARLASETLAPSPLRAATETDSVRDTAAEIADRILASGPALALDTRA